MMVVRVLGLLVLAMLVVSSTPTPLCADSWSMPTTTTYKSSNGQARITVDPRNLKSQLSYFEDKVESVEPAGQERDDASRAKARLERRSGKGWQVIWERQLVNDVAPVQAIVRDDGEYTVTFDDWHGVGHGPNVVVIYGSAGRMVRALALSDIVPAEYIKALPHSVSSIRWRGDPRFSPDGQRVLVPVTIPSDEFALDTAKVELAINLSDGRASSTDPAAWNAALAVGRTLLASRIAAEKAAKVAFLAPLLGPKVNAQREWHDYLQEAVGRLVGNDHDTPSTTVLRNPQDKDYAVSEKWVRDALTDPLGDKVALASLSKPDLITVLTKIVSKLPSGSLSNVTVFIALSDQYWPSAVSAMQKSGAKLVQLDPCEPIAQRPERIARRYGPRPTADSTDE